MPKLGFKIARRKAIDALLSGTFQHEASRSGIETKNLLFMGQVTPAYVCELLRRSNGQDHCFSPHHHDTSVEVHVIRREGWYIKFYFIDPVTFFISVHQ